MNAVREIHAVTFGVEGGEGGGVWGCGGAELGFVVVCTPFGVTLNTTYVEPDHSST